MDNEQAKKFRKRAIYSARKYGFGEHAEDLAQEVLCKFAAGQGRHQTIDQATIDAIRGNIGDPRSGNFERQRAAEREYESIEDKAHVAEPKSNGIDFERYLGMLKGIDRAVVCLRIKWGFTEDEIGHCFDLTESAISLRLKKIMQTLAFELEISNPMDLEEQP